MPAVPVRCFRGVSAVLWRLRRCHFRAPKVATPVVPSTSLTPSRLALEAEACGYLPGRAELAIFRSCLTLEPETLGQLRGARGSLWKPNTDEAVLSRCCHGAFAVPARCWTGVLNLLGGCRRGVFADLLGGPWSGPGMAPGMAALE